MKRENKRKQNSFFNNKIKENEKVCRIIKLYGLFAIFVILTMEDGKIC